MIRGMFVQYMLALSFDSSAISLWFYRLKLCSHVWCFPRGQCDVRILGWRWASLVDWGRNNPGNVQSRVALRNHSPLDFCWGASVMVPTGFVMRCMKLQYLTWIEFIHELQVTITWILLFTAPVAWRWWNDGQSDQVVMTFQTLQDWLSSIQTFKQPDDSKKLISPCRCSRFHHSNHFLVLI